MNIEDAKISIVVVEDHTVLRISLARMLEAEGFNVLGDFENGKLAIDALPALNPDIVLMDLEMPVMDGATATKWIHTNLPSIKVIALSMRADDLSVIRMLRAGVRGYVTKGIDPSDLADAIRLVHEKGYHYSDLMTSGLSKLQNNDSPMDDQGKINLLSEREIEFLKLCVSELTYKEMAVVMKVSARTIDGYRESVCDKFQLKGRTGLALMAVKLKIAAF